MDNEFIEKMNSISEIKRLSETEEQFAFSATFDKEKDGLIKITADNGELIYQLKPLKELYVEQESKKSAEEEGGIITLYELEVIHSNIGGHYGREITH